MDCFNKSIFKHTMWPLFLLFLFNCYNLPQHVTNLPQHVTNLHGGVDCLTKAHHLTKS